MMTFDFLDMATRKLLSPPARLLIISHETDFNSNSKLISFNVEAGLKMSSLLKKSLNLLAHQCDLVKPGSHRTASSVEYTTMMLFRD